MHIPAGSCIKYPIGAANRDPAVFENPDEFDDNRPPDASRNLTFGLGTHACAGQLLARAETSVILGLVAERYFWVELVGEPSEVRTDRLVAFDKLPVRLAWAEAPGQALAVPPGPSRVSGVLVEASPRLPAQAAGPYHAQQ